MERGKYPRTPENRALQRLKHLGQKNPAKGSKMSDERKREISLLTKKGMTQEARLKISLARKGTHHSDETKRKISLGGKGKQKGEKHYNWMGGNRKRRPVSNLDRSLRGEWRRKVLRRDQFACIFCKKTGKGLHVDHKLPQCLYPNSRFHVANGRTLCFDCHKATPTYGVNKKWMTAINIRQAHSHSVPQLTSST